MKNAVNYTLLTNNVGGNVWLEDNQVENNILVIFVAAQEIRSAIRIENGGGARCRFRSNIIISESNAEEKPDNG